MISIQSPRSSMRNSPRRSLRNSGGRLGHARPLYSGSKAFWRQKMDISIDIYLHSGFDCIEIIAYDPVSDSEAPRIYVSYSKAKLRLSSSDVEERYARFGEEMGSSEDSVEKNNIINELICDFILKRIMVMRGALGVTAQSANWNIYMQPQINDVIVRVSATDTVDTIERTHSTPSGEGDDTRRLVFPREILGEEPRSGAAFAAPLNVRVGGLDSPFVGPSSSSLNTGGSRGATTPLLYTGVDVGECRLDVEMNGRPEGLVDTIVRRRRVPNADGLNRNRRSSSGDYSVAGSCSSLMQVGGANQAHAHPNNVLDTINRDGSFVGENYGRERGGRGIGQKLDALQPEHSKIYSSTKSTEGLYDGEERPATPQDRWKSAFKQVVVSTVTSKLRTRLQSMSMDAPVSPAPDTAAQTNDHVSLDRKNRQLERIISGSTSNTQSGDEMSGEEVQRMRKGVNSVIASPRSRLSRKSLQAPLQSPRDKLTQRPNARSKLDSLSSTTGLTSKLEETLQQVEADEQLRMQKLMQQQNQKKKFQSQRDKMLALQPLEMNSHRGGALSDDVSQYAAAMRQPLKSKAKGGNVSLQLSPLMKNQPEEQGGFERAVAVDNYDIPKSQLLEKKELSRQSPLLPLPTLSVDVEQRFDNTSFNKSKPFITHSGGDSSTSGAGKMNLVPLSVMAGFRDPNSTQDPFQLGKSASAAQTTAAHISIPPKVNPVIPPLPLTRILNADIPVVGNVRLGMSANSLASKMKIAPIETGQTKKSDDLSSAREAIYGGNRRRGSSHASSLYNDSTGDDNDSSARSNRSGHSNHSARYSNKESARSSGQGESKDGSLSSRQIGALDLLSHNKNDKMMRAVLGGAAASIDRCNSGSNPGTPKRRSRA